MLLTVDVGNTAIKWALFPLAGGERGAQPRAVRHGRSPSARGMLAALRGANVEAAAVASVVPERTGGVCRGLARALGIRPTVAGRDFAIPMENLCRRPERVGMDRLLNGLAAHRRSGGACIVVDVGSAITVDAVDRRGRFLGGAILPGPGLQAAALRERTALLPLVKLRRPRAALGKDTEQAIRSGLYWGVVGAVEELVRRLGAQMRVRARVFATGGGGRLAGRISRRVKYDPLLTLRGLCLAYRESTGAKGRRARR